MPRTRCAAAGLGRPRLSFQPAAAAARAAVPFGYDRPTSPTLGPRWPELGSGGPFAAPPSAASIDAHPRRRVGAERQASRCGPGRRGGATASRVPAGSWRVGVGAGLPLHGPSVHARLAGLPNPPNAAACGSGRRPGPGPPCPPRTGSPCPPGLWVDWTQHPCPRRSDRPPPRAGPTNRLATPLGGADPPPHRQLRPCAFSRRGGGRR
mmetsp:Transcript_18446/g.60334  ORF Transcript_18446/g.60334 Transcript_18446/m.60334 type:complete len:208 (-) Transcript_18446:1955-2578(-)|eukprot:scaffold6760_cov119-Isochrysis_galbana.AAC.2